jgi:hypothetical protein
VKSDNVFDVKNEGVRKENVVKSGVLSSNISSFSKFSNGKGEKGKNRGRIRNGHREIGNLWTKVREGTVRTRIPRFLGYYTVRGNNNFLEKLELTTPWLICSFLLSVNS